MATDLGTLIDCSEEEFTSFCKDKDLGYLSSFHNLLVQTYNEVCGMKEELVEKMCADGCEATEEETTLLEGLYAKLLRIEHRVFLLKDIIRDRTHAVERKCGGSC